jgi:hypothetical protein
MAGIPSITVRQIESTGAEKQVNVFFAVVFIRNAYW